MKKFIKEKPWYFALCALGFILQPISEWFVMLFFDEELVLSWLQKTIAISALIPYLVFFFIFFICVIIYIIQCYQSKKQIIPLNEKDAIEKKLETTVAQNEYIESMQAFQYQIKNSQSQKYIKLCYMAGIANEQIEINTILQTYFYFPYPLYKKIKQLSGRYDSYINESNPINKDDKRNLFLEFGNSLCNQLLSELNQIGPSDEITEYHCVIYRILAKLLPAISGEAIESFLKKKDIEEKIIHRKKTGLLGALIINDLYIFQNQNSVYKRDRVYFAFPYDTRKGIVFMGSINGSCFPDDGSYTIKEYCKRIVTDICK